MEKIKKPFRQTLLGSLLTKNLPDVAQVAAKFLPENGGFGIIKNLILGANIPEDAKKAILEAAQEFELNELALFMGDISNARDMQTAGLQQSDNFSKRFIYILASFWSLAAVIFIFLVTFLKYPESNTRIVDTIMGFMLGTIIATIMQFFFGSSASSHNKNSTIAAALDNKGI